MGRYADWTKEEVWEKADWEGGVEALLDWGGADAFEALGPEAYRLAQDIQVNLRELQRFLDEVEPSNED